jgi:hypothetical protein
LRQTIVFLARAYGVVEALLPSACLFGSVLDRSTATTEITDMKHLRFIALIAVASFFVSCETTETAGGGNAEAKRTAALQERQQREQNMDESEKNLWNAQQDVLNRDGNPIGRETP